MIDKHEISRVNGWNLRQLGQLRAGYGDAYAVVQHVKVPYGKCAVCDHYGDDCTGRLTIEEMSNAK